VALYFVRWKRLPVDSTHAYVAIDERLSWKASAALGAQHLVAMFGATVLAPLLMGFDPNVAILMSGVGTLVFFAILGGRVPSYLGSSFAFIGAVNAVTGYAGTGQNARLADALGGIVVCGAVYAFVGLLVMVLGVSWIEAIMPPIVTGAVVMVIGLNLAPATIRGLGESASDSLLALLTILCTISIGVLTRGLLRRLLILGGLALAYFVCLFVGNGLGWVQPIDFGAVLQAPLVGLPHWTTPRFATGGISIIAPIAIILVVENLGHIKAISAMTGKNLDKYLGRAFVADGLATMISGSTGGTGVTTYAENIGVMAITRVYSTLPFVIAALLAIVLGLSPKFGELIHTIPAPVIAGVSVIVFGLIAAAGARIWIENRVDFSDLRNLLIAAVTLALGTGDFTLHLGTFTLGGIGTATFAAILLGALLRKPVSQ